MSVSLDPVKGEIFETLNEGDYVLREHGGFRLERVVQGRTGFSRKLPFRR
jgi:hypothetical protein